MRGQREWLLDVGQHWPFTEMDWADHLGRPYRIKWPFRTFELIIAGWSPTTTHLYVRDVDVDDDVRVEVRTIAVDDPSGSSVWRRELMGCWFCTFNPSACDLAVRDRAEILAIKFIAELRRRKK